MSGLSEGAALWGIKALGAAAGSAISVAYILPRHRREAAVRFAVGLVSGLVFGGAAGVKIAAWLGVANALGEAELMLTGSAAASLCAWWALGAMKRFAGQTFKNKAEGED
jgi:high-affinity Fe2+/Pb2+ permease